MPARSRSLPKKNFPVLVAALIGGFVANQVPAQAVSLGDQQAPGTTMMREPDRPAVKARGPFYLPALLPVLGADRPATPREPLAIGYPRESAGEPYFMAEGNLTANRLLSDPRAEAIASYRTARLTLLTELRVELDRGPEVTPAVRRQGLADLAAAQTPLLLDLEAEAEQIRRDLTRPEALKVTADDIGKFVPFGEPAELKKPLATVRMLLSGAHYRNGFSPDQRRLLEEMAQEQRLAIESDLAASRAVFFWPAGARIPVPLNLPPDAARKFDEFQQRKAALKKELRALLDRDRSSLFNLDYTEKFAQLAAAQAPRFAELDGLADQLRPALAALADVTAKPATPLPAYLTRQVADLAEHKAALQRDVVLGLWTFRRELPAERLELNKRDNNLLVVVTTSRGSRKRREEVLVGIETFNRELAARYALLAEERDAVRDALLRYQSSQPGGKPGRTVDQLAADSLAAYRAQEYQDRQRDYAAAVYTSGLSPAQRRLLLAAATVDSLQ